MQMNGLSGWPAQKRDVRRQGWMRGLLPAAATGLALTAGLCGGALAQAASEVVTNAPGTKADAEGWVSMFDGRTMTGWKETDFAGRGEVTVEDGKLVLGFGVMTGVTWTNDVPKMNYEISLEAMRVDGSDFFCGLTFPVGEKPCSLIVGGWGGGVVGLSSLDGMDAANNETTRYINFERGKWYSVRVRVESKKIQAWIDKDKVVDVDTTDRQVSIRPEVELSRPLGVATWSTTGALRKIRFRRF